MQLRQKKTQINTTCMVKCFGLYNFAQLWEQQLSCGTDNRSLLMTVRSPYMSWSSKAANLKPMQTPHLVFCTIWY